MQLSILFFLKQKPFRRQNKLLRTGKVFQPEALILQGHPMDLFLNISVLHANFCWLGDVEEIKLYSRFVVVFRSFSQNFPLGAPDIILICTGKIGSLEIRM